MEQKGLSDPVELWRGKLVQPPKDAHSLRGLLRHAYANMGTTMTDVAERSGLSRSAVAGVLGYESHDFPDREVFMAIARDLVEERYLPGWAVCWESAYSSPTRDVHPPVGDQNVDATANAKELVIASTTGESGEKLYIVWERFPTSASDDGRLLLNNATWAEVREFIAAFEPGDREPASAAPEHA